MKFRDMAAIQFRHFGMRLIERYGIYITFAEYLKLRKTPLMDSEPYPRTWYRCDVGYLEIQGKRVRVLKESKRRLLTTALPLLKHEQKEHRP